MKVYYIESNPIVIGPYHLPTSFLSTSLHLCLSEFSVQDCQCLDLTASHLMTGCESRSRGSVGDYRGTGMGSICGEFGLDAAPRHVK